MCNDLEDNSGIQETDEHDSQDLGKEVMEEEAEEVHPATDSSDNGKHHNETYTCRAVG